MFKLDVLGFWGAYPEFGEATSGYLVTTDECKILIDCGSGVLAQLHRLCRVEELTAILLSHHHHDHAADLGSLGYSALLAGLGKKLQGTIPIYHPAGCPASLIEYWSQAPWTSFHAVTDGEEIELPGLRVRFRKTLHPVECFSMRLTHRDGVLTYSADSALCDTIVEQARDADLFLCEASMYRHQLEAARQAGHLTSEQCGKVAIQANVMNLAITHFPHYGSLDVLRSEVEDAFGKPVTQVETGKQLVIGE